MFMFNPQPYQHKGPPTILAGKDFGGFAFHTYPYPYDFFKCAAGNKL